MQDGASTSQRILNEPFLSIFTLFSPTIEMENRYPLPHEFTRLNGRLPNNEIISQKNHNKYLAFCRTLIVISMIQ